MAQMTQTNHRWGSRRSRRSRQRFEFLHPNQTESIPEILYKSLRDNALRGQLSDVPYRDFIWMRQLS
jgi:hypothetical protein